MSARRHSKLFPRGTGIVISIETGAAIEDILELMQGDSDYLFELRYGTSDDGSNDQRWAELEDLENALNQVRTAFYGEDSGENPR